MRKIFMLATVMLWCSMALAQGDVELQSKITDVTVFLNRAQVSRVGKVSLPAGRSFVVFPGLSSVLDQQSVQVTGKGKFTILGINYRKNFSNEQNTAKVKQLRDSIELLQQQVQIEQSTKEILNKEEQMLMSNQKIGGANENLTVAELKAMADFFRSRLSDLILQRGKHDQRIKQLNERLSKLQMQLNEITGNHARHSSEIIVAVASDAGTTAEFDLTYVVPNAGWTPVYDLRAIDTNSPVQLSYKANVFQNTGEEWKNVKLTLSTANPALGGLKPELSPLYVDIFIPERDKRRYRYSAPAAVSAPAEMEERAYDSVDADATQLHDYTTTVQTSLNTEFSISIPYTVTSTNRPTLVDVASHPLKAEYLYSVAPKLDNDAFLIARVKGWEDLSLLPGEANVFFEGTFVGKSFIDPTNINDTLNVSLGRDKRIVVTREKMKDYTTKRVIGINQRDLYGFEISIRNTKREPVKIIVEDQIPVSQNSQVEVDLVDAGGAVVDKPKGKLRWDLSLNPSESRKLAFRFEVKYPKNQKINQIE